MSLLFSNNAQTTIAGSISNTAVAVALAPGTGAEFPSPAAGQTFLGTFNDAATGLLYEIVSVTARSTDTLTIVRAQESTVALAWSAGDIFGNFMTAGTAAAFVQLPLSSNPAGGGLSVVQVYAGNPNGHIAGNAGVAATSPPDTVWDTTDGSWWTCITSGSTSTAVWQRAPSPTIGVASAVNLAGSAPGSTKTAAWTVDQIIAATTLAGATFLGTSLSLTFNGGGTGANGMDTGSTPTSASLYVYAIYNPTTATPSTLGTISGNGATIYAGANMPSGYTASCLIGMYATNGSGQLLAFTQQGRVVSLPATAIFTSTGGVATLTSQSISAVVPVGAKTVSGTLQATSTSSAGNPRVAADASGTGAQQGTGTAASVSNVTPGLNFNDLVIKTSQTLFWDVGSTANAWNMSVSKYTF